MTRTYQILLAVLAMIGLAVAPASASTTVVLNGSFDRTVLKPEFTGSTCAPDVNGDECGVLQFTGLGAADYIYVYGPTFEPNGTRGCFTIDGTFTIRLESDGSTISGPLGGVFCSLSGRRTPQAYRNPFTEEDSINFGNGTGRFAALRGTAIFQQSAAGARNRGTLVGTLSD